ncbi:hypothetical protein L1049_013828 [Liquidambar formosana]|uniref:Receptor-like serine/threonine-protein kinase n=1 Tax=Liquidambar formosana TaxID=63359 RepID=A0AAP0RQT4_LIQFO
MYRILSPSMLSPTTTLLFISLLLGHISDLGCRVVSSSPVIAGSSTILSDSKTFKLGFFSPNSEKPTWYFGIWYASIPTPNYVWVANRESPVRNLSSSRVEITDDGFLAVIETEELVVWKSTNTEKSTEAKLLDDGNLVLLSEKGKMVWQSFDFPADTWLPGMNITKEKSITCWRSPSDPSPGMYSLRLKPPQYGEFELVFNGSNAYWSTGNWTGNAFSGVPQMTIKYIYKFHFDDPFTPMASFWYTETSLDSGLPPPLTRFQMDYTGQLKQFTWWPQTETWNMFWSQPESPCRVYGLCGNLGFCNNINLKPCECLSGFRPVDDEGWNSKDYSGGCRRESDKQCGEDDQFEEVGAVSFNGAVTVLSSGSRSFCEGSCLGNCSCIGLYHNGRTNLCKNLYGSLLNLRNLTSDGTDEDVLYVRVERGSITKKNNVNMRILGASLIGLMAVLALFTLILLVLRRRRERRKKEEDDAVFPVTNLKLFSYKELQTATRGFSEKLGHGGFGVVFRGELSDSSPVAVKRLERPGGAEKEFRAEVCTIGNIQHVNLVRLRGFCSENSHRLLVYDYMQNGPLSVYLRRDGPNLSWDVRFRVAIGMARGIAYLHEECRDCIIHCDIKPENILLDGEFIAKVSDFGLAKLIGRDFSRVLTMIRGTRGYVAPEWISGVAITAKADVYSYGMTLLELISGRRNVEAPPSAGGGGGGTEASGGEKWFFPPWAALQIIEGRVKAVVDERLGGIYNIAEAERLGLVAVWCIQDDEAMRPTMGMVVKMLEGIVEVVMPPPPKLLQALVSGESFRGVVVDSSNRTSTGGGHSGDNVGVSGGSLSSLGNNSLAVDVNVDV